MAARSATADQSAEKEVKIKKKATLGLNPQICQDSLETYCLSCRQNTTSKSMNASQSPALTVPAPFQLFLYTSQNSKLPKVAEFWVLLEKVKGALLIEPETVQHVHYGWCMKGYYSSHKHGIHKRYSLGPRGPRQQESLKKWLPA